ncbi:MAG TPA: glycosyltransferase family 9 protein [Longimicrobiales bacterium]|nr:glycosyltransferase family 9 protein [Longimicrobiales bacterium]
MNICVVLLTGLGDVVHGLPVVNAIKRQYPDAHITWVVEPMPSGILRPHPSVDEVVVFHKKNGLAGVRQLRREMAGRTFDVVLNFNIYFKSIWGVAFSRAPRRIGFGRPIARDGVSLFANEHLPRKVRAHTQEMFLDFLLAMGIAPGELQWLIPITEPERTEQEMFFAQLRDRPVIGVVGASANKSKDWPADRYPKLVDALVEQFNAHVVLLGGPGERELAVARNIIDTARYRAVWGLGDSIRRLVWLIDGCNLIIAPDTGPVHIARALEVPVLGLYGHTNPWRVGPYEKYNDLWIDRYTDGAPDPTNFAPKAGRMELITIEDILEKVALAIPRNIPRNIPQ